MPELLLERRRSTATLRSTDLLSLFGAAGASVGLTALVFALFAPFNGKLGFVLLAWVLFVGLYTLLVSFDEDSPTVRDRAATVAVHSLAFVVLLALVLIVVYTFFRGRDALLQSNFYTQDLSNTGPLDPIASGGIVHAIIGTLEQITLGLLISIPLGLTCAVFLSEVPGRFARLVRTISEAMTALPSIVAGLFIYASWILVLGQGKSGLAAALALSVMMLPIIIRASDVVLRLVPGSLKEASLALGTSQWRTIWHVTLPTARSGLATAIILGAARGIGETSPVLLTAGYTATTNLNPFNGAHTSLPLAAFTLVQSPNATQIARGFGAGATLLVLVLALFLLARLIGGRGPGELTRRQRARRTTASTADLQRFTGSPAS
ncbi:MAG: phosphate ABC transporter permease PstA [Frankiales bacterium]|nr:phosphate ABC transporter permease PstA [Frankiales bacterium]